MSASPVRLFRGAKARGERLAMISLYDAPGAALCCDAGVDVLLVGDSLGNVVLGYENTLAVTIGDMVHHTAAVARGARGSSRPEVPIIADLPFGGYASVDLATMNGASLVRAGAHGVKLEGAGPGALAAVRALVEMGVPVTGELSIPTIGIGAGPGCDGQVLVWHDLVGLTPGKPLRFVKRYADAHALLAGAAGDFVDEVRSGAFPEPQHGWSMNETELRAWSSESEV